MNICSIYFFKVLCYVLLYGVCYLFIYIFVLILIFRYNVFLIVNCIISKGGYFFFNFWMIFMLSIKIGLYICIIRREIF